MRLVVLLLSISSTLAGCGARERTADDTPPPVAPTAPATPEEPDPEPAPDPAADRPDDAIAFVDPALAAMYARARACIERRADPNVWHHHGPEGAAMREERWCAPDGPCTDASQPFTAGQTSFHLRTMTGTAEERLELVATETGRNGWVTTVWLQPWTGGFSFDFARGEEHFTVTAEHCVTVMDQQLCASAEEAIAPPTAWHARELRAHAASDAALRDRVLLALTHLRDAVTSAVREHALTTCDEPDAPDRFEHVESGRRTGMVDTCARRPLTRAEERTVLRDARAEIAAREAQVRRSYAVWWHALYTLFPVDECWLGTAEPAEVASAGDADDVIAWAIAARPRRFSVNRIDQVEIQIRATNRGSATVDPGRTSLGVTLDGEEHFALAMAFGNGATGPEWRALLPGHTARDSRIGVELTDAPGRHVLALVRGDRELARTTFTVTP